jgi:hypothetical protein
MDDSILSFVEDIVSEYDLEKDILANDPALAKAIDEADDRADIPVIKILYSQKVKERLDSGMPIEDVLPSIKLTAIIDSLIKKSLSYDVLPEVIKKKLEVDSAISEKISDQIKNNAEILKERNASAEEKGDTENLSSVGERIGENKKSIGYQLLK